MIFQAIVGDKYGYRPIPSVIDEVVFKNMTSTFASLGGESPKVDLALLQQAYRKDENAIPAVYVLQRISTMVPEYASLVSVTWCTCHCSRVLCLRMLLQSMLMGWFR